MPSLRILSLVRGVLLQRCRFPSCRLFLPAAMLLVASVAMAAPSDPDALRERSIAVLRQVLGEEQKWVKVHAAESLLFLGYPAGVREAFLEELKLHGDEPQYRIGIWRVLAKSAHQDAERKDWVEKIVGSLLNPESPDRIHAAETLSKFPYRLMSKEVPPVEQAAQSEDQTLAMMAAWLLAVAGDAKAEEQLAAGLDSASEDIRLDAAYGFRHLPDISSATQKKLLEACRREPKDSKVRAFLVGAVAVHSSPDDRTAWKNELLALAAHADRDARTESLYVLAQIADDQDRLTLLPLLDDADPDVRSAAAVAILRIERRAPHYITGWDWSVIAVYALGMLSVGWYFSRRTKTQEQYLLGDRQMRPLMVGISLFASLISIISYLAEPGEIIKNGPMLMVASSLAYPIIYVVVGWLMIPFIMRLKVTSAYEILELRLGPTVRTLGSLFFLSLRLMWMSVIVYATASKVLIPMLGLNPSITPLVCAILAFVTIIYTSMGGLRAVVITDVIQTAILFIAAIATICVVTVSLGGVEAWWPQQWLPHWAPLKIGFDANSRLTLCGVMLAVTTWYVCTSASDQICIQRYLSTRDAKAARSVLLISLVANFLVSLILGSAGLGLLAYFQAFPNLLPDAQGVLADGDKLFPRFIMVGLPVGLSGLVVAGLLACAMSALSAGINSTCSVITVDIIDRIRGKSNEPDAGRVRQLKNVSVVVGLIVVFLSCFVNMVQGNLVDVCYKIVNLLTAPLAGLFFLSMFVSWARGFGAIVGAIFGFATVVVLSYWREITGGQDMFIWAMPVSLVVEVVVGALVSLIPIGYNAPLLDQLPAAESPEQ